MLASMKYDSLIHFENSRALSKYIPPVGSNTYYNVQDGVINIFSGKSTSDHTKLDVYTDSGEVLLGDGEFTIYGDTDDNRPYGKLIIITGTKISISGTLVIDGGTLEVHGDIEFLEGSGLTLKNSGKITFYSDSTFIANNAINIITDNTSSFDIYGKINIPLSMVDSVLNNRGISIDSAAVVNVIDLGGLGEREFSLTDYDTLLRSKVLNINSQGETNSISGRIGYKWLDGSPLNGSQVIDMYLLLGEAVLGDFKLSALGTPSREVSNLQIVSNLYINHDTTLYITEHYHGYRYIRPTLYLGVIIGNNTTPAKCVIDGTVIADGENSSIVIDRSSSLYINGELYLKNNSVIKSTHNPSDAKVLYINGTLTIDDISQISSLTKDNIVFGENGKVRILNPDTGEKRILFTTPNGIRDSDLYRIFYDNIEHIEYHISNNTGIAIDQNFEYFHLQMTKWYADRRIEKSIHDGLLVWHNGGFININKTVVPWVNSKCNLFHAAKFFKSYGSTDAEKLQEVAERLRYAGAGNILFRFILDGMMDSNKVVEVTLVLDHVGIKNVYNNALTDSYVLSADNIGELFIRNKVNDTRKSSIIKNGSKIVMLKNGENSFQL